jgi:GGDEF domain-containing protein
LVAWVFAGFTLWLNIVFNVTGMAFWLLVLFAASIGGWSRMFPARRQVGMFSRAVLLLVAALLLQLSAGLGAAIGPYAFLAPLSLVFYLLLLAAPWAIALVLLTLAAFGLSCWLTLAVVAWPAVLAYAGALVCIPLIALQFGSALRLSDENTESSLRDDRTQLYNETGFFVHGAVLLAECRQQGRPFCMVLLNGADLLDIPGLLGRKVANDLFAQVVRGIAGVSGEGIAARTDSVEFALLLPGVTAERAASLVKQQLGDPPNVEVKLEAKDTADPQPITIVLDMAIAQSQDKAENIEELYDTLHARWIASKVPIPKNGPTAAKALVLGPDDDRVSAPRRAASPTVPMDLRHKGRPWDK